MFNMKKIHFKLEYPQATSRCWTQSVVTNSSSRPAFEKNKAVELRELSELFDGEMVSDSCCLSMSGRL